MGISVFQRHWVTEKGEPKEAWAWKVTYREPDGRKRVIRRTAQVDSERGATEEAERALAAVNRGTFEIHKGAPTFAEVAREFLEARDIKPSTRKRYADSLDRVLLPHFGRKLIGDVEGEIERFKKDWGEGREVTTLGGHLSVLRAILHHAHEKKHLTSSPVVKLPKDRRPKPPPRWFTPAQMKAILAAADGVWGVWILVAARTGLRLGEMLALRWRSIDVKRGILHVEASIVDDVELAPKSGAGRSVPLSKQARAALKSLQRGEPDAFVFPEVRTKDQVSGALDRIGKKAELPERLGAHDLRHHFCSSAVIAGVDLRTVQLWAGHSSIKQTERYAQHAAPKGEINVLDRLERKTG
jgi:integrase